MTISNVLFNSNRFSLILVDEGGVCSKFSPDPTSPTGGRSRNIGFVSFSNEGRPLPEQVTKLIFIHEIGHSLGSPVSDCSK